MEQQGNRANQGMRRAPAAAASRMGLAGQAELTRTATSQTLVLPARTFWHLGLNCPVSPGLIFLTACVLHVLQLEAFLTDTNKYIQTLASPLELHNPLAPMTSDHRHKQPAPASALASSPEHGGGDSAAVAHGGKAAKQEPFPSA